MNIEISKIFLLGLVFVLLLSSPNPAFGASPTPTEPTEQRSTIQYYKELIIKENSGKTLTDYQVLVELQKNDFPDNAKSDGSDIRFTDAKGKELSYWIEKWDHSGENAKMWANIPSIPGSGTTTIYMYYGNAGVGSESDGGAVFEFFDDFEGTSLDANKWDGSDSKGSYGITVADSDITLKPLAGDGYAILDSKTPFGVNTALRFRSKYGDMGYDDWAGIGYHKDWQNFIEVHEDGDAFNSECFMCRKDDNPEHTPSPVDLHIWHTFDIIRNDATSIAFYADGKYEVVHTEQIPVGEYGIRLFSIQGSVGSGQPIYLNWILVRKYTHPEPTITVGAEQTSPTLTPAPTQTDDGSLTGYALQHPRVTEDIWSRTFGGTSGDSAHSVQQTSDGGYIFAGTTKSYGAGHYDAWLVKTDSNGNKEWDKTFGEGNGDSAHSVQQTSDGGYILAGTTHSYGAGFGGDFWLVKTDSNGNKEWGKTFGGIMPDGADSVQQTSDGGYILAGRTGSYGAYGAGSWNFWLVKTDSNGNKQWDKTFGGTETDFAYYVQQTSDGGYILAGETESYGAGLYDAWLVKTDSNGNKEWDKTFGGTDDDSAHSVQQTSDGGYILAGETQSYGDSGHNFWLVKTDSNGNKEWDKTFGGTDDDSAHSVQQTSDGGYILAGETQSYGDSGHNFWLVKTDSNGNKEWDKTFGGTAHDSSYSFQQTSDRGYILAACVYLHGAGSNDAWLVKTDSNGNKEWDKIFGGTAHDSPYSVQQTSDSGYILAGYTESCGAGSKDAWLVKIDSNGNTQLDNAPTLGETAAITPTSSITRDTPQAAAITPTSSIVHDTPQAAATNILQQNKTSKTILIFGGVALLLILVLLAGKSRRKKQETPRPTSSTPKPTPLPESRIAKKAAQRLAELRSDASSKLEMAKSMLNKAEQLGIDMSRLKDLLAKAEQAYQEENYTYTTDRVKKYIALIDRAEENKKQLEQMRNNASGILKFAKSSLQKAERLGVTAQHAKELNIKAQSAFDAGDYSSAISYASQSKDAAEKSIDGSKPSISVELPPKMQYNLWRRRDITVTNTGTAHAKDVTITFLTALKVRELEVIKKLDVGERKTININMKPTEKGEVPVDYSVEFKDLMDRNYKIEDTFNLGINTDAEMLEGRADYEQEKLFAPTPTAPTTHFTTLRTVWDPSNKAFVWDAEKPDEYGELPRIKRWIEDKNPNIYWFLLKIVNHADCPVNEWNATLYTEQALTITEAHIDEKEVRIVKSDFDTDRNKNICVVAIPPELGVSIPANGGRRSMYFKMDIRCEDALKMEFGVSGVVKLGKSPQVEVPIREKRFTYACKYGDFRNMYYGSIDALASLVAANLQNSYNHEILQNFTNSFRLIREFEKYCNDRYAESEILVGKLEVIHSSLKAAEPITKDEILPLVKKELGALQRMAAVEGQKERGIRMCEKLVELLHIAASKVR